MSISVIQAPGGASSVAAPASIAPTWASTQPGTTLVMVLGLAISAAQTVTPPANWVRVNNQGQGTNVVVQIWVLAGQFNPGGITSQTVNLTNVNGAAWQLFELAGGCGGPTLAALLLLTGNNASTTAIGPLGFSPHTWGNTFDLFAAAFLSGGGLYTPANTVPIGTATNTSQQTSTTGATNVSLVTAYGLMGPTPQRGLLLGGNIGSATAAAWIMAMLLATDSQPTSEMPSNQFYVGASPASIGGL